MNMIVAVDKNWGIGYQNDLLVQIPSDQKFFYQMTKNKVIVLGRKTLETFPNQVPLAERTNIVLTRKKEKIRGAVCVSSLEETLKILEAYNSEDIFIVGGASVYKQFLPYCDTIHVTKIHYMYQADAYFPNLDTMPEWIITKDSEEETYFDLEYTFYQYERKKL